MQAVGHFFRFTGKVSWEAKNHYRRGIMTTEWSLDELYKGFDDPAYGKDVAELTAQIDALATLLADARKDAGKGKDREGACGRRAGSHSFSISYRSMWN